jgi:nucleoside-diphosphate-sugar epimerase
MTRVAVTGASGFLGRHVMAALRNTNADVIAHARAPQPGLANSERDRWIFFDIAATSNDVFTQLGSPDVVIHLAWGGLPNYLSQNHVSVEFPVQCRFLRALVATGLKTLVIAGTCLEYGMQTGCLHEDMQPAPSSPYGLAKDTLRREMISLLDARPLELRWLRLFYLYGDGQSATSLYSQFRAAVVRRDRKFDMSVGDQVRDFMKAEDAAAAIARIALATDAPEIINVCSGAPITVRKLVERWRTELASDIELNFGALPYPAYEPFAFWGDNRRLSKFLGG